MQSATCCLVIGPSGSLRAHLLSTVNSQFIGGFHVAERGRKCLLRRRASHLRPQEPSRALPQHRSLRSGCLSGDGNFEFVVKSVKCGITEVGGEYLNKKAQGQFCLATVTVTNIGNEARTFSSGNQQAYIGDVQYEPDSSASFYANSETYGDAGKAFLNEINPGNSVEGIVVFDIPKGKKLSTLELHDGAFSGGVQVLL